MAADRKTRDRLADVLASALQGADETDALDAIFEELHSHIGREESPPAKQDKYLYELTGDWVYRDKRFRARTEREWSHACRSLAFLKTDLEPQPWEPEQAPVGDADAERSLARWHLLGLVVASCAGMRGFYAFGLYSMLRWIVLPELAPIRARHAALRRRIEYAPFADQAEWFAHRYLLDDYHLPPYGTRPILVRRQDGWKKAVRVALDKALFAGIILQAVIIFLAFVPIWPVLLIVISISRSADGTVRQQDDVSPS